MEEDTEPWSINILKEKAEQILFPCINSFDYAIEYQGNMACKIMIVRHCRINEEDKGYQGKIELKMNYDEIKEKFEEENKDEDAN